MIDENNKVNPFESTHIRSFWDEEKGKWWYSVVDVIADAMGSDHQESEEYWKALKDQMLVTGDQQAIECHQLMLESSDGEKYLTDVADDEQILQIVKSIPNIKAEPFTEEELDALAAMNL